MKRDWDLLRDILNCIEEHDRTNLSESDWTPERAYHVWLLLDAGLIAGLEAQRDFDGRVSDFTWQPVPMLTVKGHDFLDTIRDDTIWKKTKAYVMSAGGALTLSVIVNVASQCLAKKLGLSP
ncbi:MAG TPA: DUF2513 domain-containing protein [Chthoniobacteraceae bacterium]|nr:DUF2513 domain-containing protein [Chthoniobacteraceae bacterium]